MLVCTTANPCAIPSGLGVVSALQMPVWVTLLAIGGASLLALDPVMRSAAQPVSARLLQHPETYCMPERRISKIRRNP
jgi:hypothetical protein